MFIFECNRQNDARRGGVAFGFGRLALVGVALWVAACSGGGGVADDDDDDNNDDGPMGGKGQPGPDESCDEAADAAFIAPRAVRLTARQYRNTLRDTFGYKVKLSSLPQDSFHDDGLLAFDTYAEGLLADSEIIKSYSSVAETAAEALMDDVKAAHSCVLDGPDSSCLESFVDDYGSRAFRRPLSGEERSRFEDFFEASEDSWDAEVAAALTLQALLLSPNHLYRTELGSGDSADKIRLTDYEVAAQISYAVADSPPDEELLSDAEKGRLGNADKRREHARRLLATERGQQKISEMLEQMYQLRTVLDVSKDDNKHPDFDADIKADMLAESLDLIERALFKGAGGIPELLGADSSRMTGRLARFYGLDHDGADDEVKRVDLPKERRGLMSHGSILAATSSTDHTSPNERGVFVFSRLLCGDIPPPDPTFTDLAAGRIEDDSKPKNTQREHWEFALEKAPECTGCHRLFVPIGLGFETFDEVGRYRPEQYGKTLDPSIDLADTGTGLEGSFDSGVEMVADFARSTEGMSCFVRHARGFLTGILPGPATSCRNESLARHVLDNEGSLESLVAGLVASDAFIFRSAPSSQ